MRHVPDWRSLQVSIDRLRAGMRCRARSEEHTSELQSRVDLVCRLLLEKKKNHEANPHEVGQAKMRTNNYLRHPGLDYSQSQDAVYDNTVAIYERVQSSTQHMRTLAHER